MVVSLFCCTTCNRQTSSAHCRLHARAARRARAQRAGCSRVVVKGLDRVASATESPKKKHHLDGWPVVPDRNADSLTSDGRPVISSFPTDSPVRQAHPPLLPVNGPRRRGLRPEKPTPTVAELERNLARSDPDGRAVSFGRPSAPPRASSESVPSSGAALGEPRLRGVKAPLRRPSGGARSERDTRAPQSGIRPLREPSEGVAATRPSRGVLSALVSTRISHRPPLAWGGSVTPRGRGAMT